VKWNDVGSLKSVYKSYNFVNIYLPIDVDFQCESNDFIFTENESKLTMLFYN
jgi:hypothetical protein